MANKTKKRMTKKEHRKKSMQRSTEIKNKKAKAQKELVEFLNKTQKEAFEKESQSNIVSPDVVDADQLELGDIEPLE